MSETDKPQVITAQRRFTDPNGANVAQNLWLLADRKVNVVLEDDGTEVETTRTRYIRRVTNSKEVNISAESSIVVNRQNDDSVLDWENRIPTSHRCVASNSSSPPMTSSTSSSFHNGRHECDGAMLLRKNNNNNSAVAESIRSNREVDVFTTNPCLPPFSGLNVVNNQPRLVGLERIFATATENGEGRMQIRTLKNTSLNSAGQLTRDAVLDDNCQLTRVASSCSTSASVSADEIGNAFATMLNSIHPMVEQQRNEFMQMFPQFKHIRGMEPEVTVRRITEPDGSLTTVKNTVMRRQIEFKKRTTVVNGLVQSSITRAVMVYGGRKNGFQVKLERIQASQDDSEAEDEESDDNASSLPSSKRLLSIGGISSNETSDSESAIVPLSEKDLALVKFDDVSSIVIQPKQQSKMRKLDKAWLSAKELVDTERRYVLKLRFLDQVFRRKVEQLQEKSLDTEKSAKLFSNLTSLFTFHSEHLLPSLEERLLGWKQNQKICDIMCKLAPYLKMYSEFTNNYNNSTKIYEEMKRKNKRFSAVVREIQAMPECENLPLDAHIICPVQRVARYHLLLKQYLDYLPVGHIDRADAEIALQKVKDSANHANNLMRKLDKYKDVIEIQEALGNQIQCLLTPSRELVKKGRLTKISHRSNDFQERHVLLFNDLMLLCSDRRVPLSKYKLRAALSLEGMEIIESDNLEHENAFLVSSNNKRIEFLAKSYDEKMEWMDTMWKTVQNYREARESFEKVIRIVVCETLPVKKLPYMCKNLKAKSVEIDEGVTDSSDKGVQKICHVCKSKFASLPNEEDICNLCNMSVCKRCMKLQSGESCSLCVNCFDKKRSQSVGGVNAAISKDSTKKKNNEPEEKCVIKGYLEIRSSKTAWIRRYFALHSDSVLQSFKNDQALNCSSVLLHGCTVTIVDPRQDSAAAVNTFVYKLVYPNRTYYFRASTQVEFIKWLAALELASQAELKE